MPLVVLDPDMSTVAMVLAFVLPFCVHDGWQRAGAADLRPLTRAAAILILLSLMVWGSLWGITGMVLAVPITAVSRSTSRFSSIQRQMAGASDRGGRGASGDGRGGASV